MNQNTEKQSFSYALIARMSTKLIMYLSSLGQSINAQNAAIRGSMNNSEATTMTAQELEQLRHLLELLELHIGRDHEDYVNVSNAEYLVRELIESN